MIRSSLSEAAAERLYEMPISYKFIRVDSCDAVFTRDMSVFKEFLNKLLGGKTREVDFTEKNCRELYLQARDPRPEVRQAMHTPTQDSMDEMKRGFYAIRTEKRRLNIPFDVEDL
jgi:hypothetical protein